MCFSSLVLSRRPKTLKKRTQSLKNPLTPIGSCRELHRPSQSSPRASPSYAALWGDQGGVKVRFDR